ncbi:NifU-like protein involved in Fe-S cluster formation [Novosphingobium chloroacetimidivorans]|uniref:NifU-like protein involved in Fe-S cluster formation n=1 Tax=Novosphingobium chloroacetimidivorans TaxID=1428314 RepID=A0A7W7K6X3_9SPHN|nr:iron-sulfur cluster assembly scaffold protein [Novosphingobium chloroacetimidivorans]MBB4856824.1 NifU-like protein involved in Fe-S cluster formation [Novosphingobium chloroacetimidivorans]
MASAAVLYSPEVLALATGLAAYRLDDALVLRTEARSRSCGSALTLGLALDADGNVARVGLRSQACAIGQASAAIFAQAAQGRSTRELTRTADAMSRWIAGEEAMPDWPGLATIAVARDYPGRHGALMLPWTAVLQLLPSAGDAS